MIGVDSLPAGMIGAHAERNITSIIVKTVIFFMTASLCSGLAYRIFCSQAWLKSINLSYHSPHKFRHRHIQYGLAQAKSIADYKAISLNILHSSVEITDQTYSNINDDEVKNRISGLGKNQADKDQDIIEQIKKLLEQQRRNS